MTRRMTLPAAVRCRELRYRYGATIAADGIDLEVRPGEIFGLLGPNGAGKTTTIRALTTLLPVPADTVWVFGLDVCRHKMAVRRLIGYVPQLLSADGALTGRENVGLFARLYDVPRRARRARIDEVLAVMGLTGAADRPAATYSGGMIRRLELAQALVSGSVVGRASRPLARVWAMCLVELQKMRRDRTELVVRAVQPALWLVVFGTTFARLRAIPTGDVPYLDFLAPGVIAQSGLFISIFYGTQIIWDRDAGILAKLLATPTPRAALVAGKAFAAGTRALSQAVVVLVLAAVLGVAVNPNPFTCWARS
jgi:ABC-type lipopolysaccharide export system ATPase subunit